MSDITKVFNAWQRQDIERLRAIRLKQESRERNITFVTRFFGFAFIVVIILLIIFQPK